MRYSDIRFKDRYSYRDRKYRGSPVHQCIAAALELNASKIAWHQIFHGKLSFVDKKMSKKSRFCELSAEEIQQITDKDVPETTKKASKFGMRLFNGMYLLSFF